MRLFGRVSTFSLAIAFSGWLCYVCLMVQHFYNTAIRVPQTQRVARETTELRLPRLYFCPADRGRMAGFRWVSFECKLSYKDENRTCPARLQAFRGREPEEFRGSIAAQEAGKEQGGECIEFGTHMVGVREEWSAAWNEITLRAAFHPASIAGVADALQEVELGYLPVEWEIVTGHVQRYYYPLLRIPFFFGSRVGVATRVFLSREVDRGLASAGKYWFTYGAIQIAVVNASTPNQAFIGAPAVSSERLAVAHVVLTLEDFQEFDFQVVSGFYPMLGTLGQICGVGAMLAFLLTGPRLRSSRSTAKEEEASASFRTTAGGAEYARVASPEDEGSGSGEEAQALLGTEAKRESRARGEDRGSTQALLGGASEEGVDGL